MQKEYKYSVLIFLGCLLIAQEAMAFQYVQNMFVDIFSKLNTIMRVLGYGMLLLAMPIILYMLFRNSPTGMANVGGLSIVGAVTALSVVSVYNYQNTNKLSTATTTTFGGMSYEVTTETITTSNREKRGSIEWQI